MAVNPKMKSITFLLKSISFINIAKLFFQQLAEWFNNDQKINLQSASQVDCINRTFHHDVAYCAWQ